MQFDETNGSQVEQVDPNDLGDEQIPSEAIKNLAISDVRPKEPQVAQEEEEQQVPNIIQVQDPSSTQVAPPSTQ